MAAQQDPGPAGFLASLRRAWFLRSLRRRDEEPPPGAVPRLNLRERRMIRSMLAHPEQDWTLDAIWYSFLLPPVTVTELGGRLSAAGLASVVWANGKRCLVLSELGTAELPSILALYRSQAPLVVLVREGPKAAGLLWWLHHRDRVWRRARRRELPRGRDPREDSDHGDGPGSGLLW